MKRKNEFIREIRNRLKDKTKPELKKIILNMNLNIRERLKEQVMDSKAQTFKEAKQEVFERDGYKCRLCREETKCEVHHLTQKSLGGGNSIGNLILLCPHCHLFLHCNPKIALNHQRQSVRDGMEEARRKGKQIGRPKGSRDKRIRSKKGYYKPSTLKQENPLKFWEILP